MKLYTLLFFGLFALSAKAQTSDTLAKALTFDNVKNELKEGYGTTAQPIGTGAFIEMMNAKLRSSRMKKLYNTFRWPNGKRIDFSKRASEHLTSGIVDKYTLVNPVTKDTVVLVVDPYKLDKAFFAPKGLIAVDKQFIVKEVAPNLNKIEELNAAENGSALKLHLKELAAYIFSMYDIDYFTNYQKLKDIVNDKQVDASLKEYLFLTSVFNSFYAHAKNRTDIEQFVYDGLKKHFNNYVKYNAGVNKGDIEKLFK